MRCSFQNTSAGMCSTTKRVACPPAPVPIYQIALVNMARYHAQIGVYATAVEALTGQTPDTHLYYIRYAYTANVDEATWKAALNTLDGDIAEALRDED